MTEPMANRMLTSVHVLGAQSATEPVEDSCPSGMEDGARRARNGAAVDWQHLRRRLAAVRGRWDLAVIANLARGVTRPGDLIASINAQAVQDHELSWTVLTRTLRRMEDEGYLKHQEVSRLPRVTRYWLTPAGWRLVRWLTRVETFSQEADTAGDHQCPGGDVPCQAGSSNSARYASSALALT